MQKARPAAAGVLAVAKRPIITGGAVGEIHAAARPVTDIVGTEVSVIAAAGSGRIKTTVGLFLTGVALRAGAGGCAGLTESAPTGLQSAAE